MGDKMKDEEVNRILADYDERYTHVESINMSCHVKVLTKPNQWNEVEGLYNE